MFFDLHRHDEYSFYDGSGKAIELAKVAVEKGYTSLGLSNHGNTNGLIQHYDACKSVGIKPIMGVEGYFLPVYKPQTRGYHLCLFAKNLKGYENMNRIQSLGDMQKFYNPIWDFDMLEKHHEGLICSTACVAGYLGQCIIKDEHDKARKFLRKMKRIFEDDFYVEVQPYKISEEGVQEKVNVEAIKLADELGIKCIMTSDSHRGRKEDIEPYLKMHELKSPNPEYIDHVRETYSERYMPTEDEICTRFCNMHRKDFGVKVKEMARDMVVNLEEIEDKVDGDIIDQLAKIYSLPKFDEEQDSYKLLVSKVKAGLKRLGLLKNPKYVERAKEELHVIKSNNFEDYFLIVQDYTLWAKTHGVGVGPGRGSGCNCLVNYALGITEVDPIYFDLDFKRFIREDKKQLPDIDIDFETSRRAEVQKYIIEKYPGHACQIASYGMYKVDNLVNDLVKLYDDLKADADAVKDIKRVINSYQNEEKQIDTDRLLADPYASRLNKIHKGFFDAFAFLYNKVKYMGTHAAGVAITRGSIYMYTAVKVDKQPGKLFSAYNLVDLERCGVIKYDVLGLGTLSSITTLRQVTGVGTPDFIELSKDQEVVKAFGEGRCNGIFQYDKKAAQELLKQIGTDCFNDIVAASAMNRPGPLSQGIPSIYAESKLTYGSQKDKAVYSEIIDSTYGCILYQEQVNAIAVEYGGLSWNEADKLRKMDDPASLKSRELLEKYYDDFVKKFIKGMKRYGYDADDAKELFDKFLNYTFNKGHAVGYALVSLEEMFYKVYYPNEFWYTKLNQEHDEASREKFMAEACNDGIVIFLPHVNYSANFSMRKVDGEYVIQKGLSSIKGVGEKAASFIEQERKKNGIFTSFDDFYDRCKSRVVTSRVIDILKSEGALEFKKKIYIERVTKYNSALYSRSMQAK